MLRPVENPPNPFLGEHIEWLGPPPPVEVKVYEEEPKAILSRNDSPDVHFRWSVNPYRGCFHACAYCYARPSHEYLGFGSGSDFESRLVVKRNAPERLREELMDESWLGELIAFSGDTDCYQPLEAVWKLTRRCLEVCAEFRNPVGIITKGLLIRRDIDVLQAMVSTGYVHVIFSIAFADDETARRVEPQAPPPSRRFEALRALSEAGIPTAVLLAPIIPGLNDRQIPLILERARDAGAQHAHPILLRLPGNVRTVFLERMEQAFPDRIRRIEARIRDTRGGWLSNPKFFERHRGEGIYWDGLHRLFEISARRLGLEGGFRLPDPSPFRRPGPRQLSLFA
ncbi:MAG: PA0069 family radical SAM protein [Planctomycetes bacterium]|nr:PA0069 family radical SAM protein [Planctomycetota bacterium]